MGLFNRGKSGGLMNVIRCDEQEYLVWKWRPAGQEANSTTRENSIRYGSSLRVKDGEVAVFVYKQKDGPNQDFIEGPYDDTIKTANFPVLSGIVGLAFGGQSPFQAEIYFINLQGTNQVRFAIPYFGVVDPRLPDFPVPVAVRGTLTFALEDYRNFIKLNRLINFDLDAFRNQIKDAMTRKIKGIVTNVPSDLGMPVVQMERKIDEISEYLEEKLRSRFDEFGVKMRHIDINAIEIDTESDEYLRVKGLTGDITAKTMQTQADLAIENMQDMQALNKENLKESMRIQREEAQRAQRLQTESTYIGAHGLNLQAGVLNNAVKNMGNAGTVPTGGQGGINPAAMMTGMAVGGALGGQMAGMINNMGQQIQNAQQQPPSMPGAAPAGGMTPPSQPAAPSVSYMVGLNGAQYGPYTVAQLSQMVAAGQINAQTLVWTQGMPAWTQACMVPELAGLFAPAPGMSSVPPMPGGMTPPPLQ